MTSLLTLLVTFSFTSADLTAASAGPAGGDSVHQRAHEVHWVLQEVQSMSAEERAELYLGSHRVLGAKPAVRLALRVREFLADPTVRGFGELPTWWFAPYVGDLVATPRQLVELQVMVVRNLSFANRQITRATVQHEVQRIRAARAQYAQISLFSQREVVYAASHDLLPGGRPMFGRDTTQRQLRQRSGSFQFLQPDAPEQEGTKGLDALAASFQGQQALTFFFEGHGRSEVLQFDGKLSATHLARLLATAGGRETVVIASACQAHGFVRLLMEELRRIAPEQRLPVMIVPEEYGQNFVTDAFNDDFKRNELGLATGADRLVDLFANANIATSVYVPDQDNTPMQVL